MNTDDMPSATTPSSSPAVGPTLLTGPYTMSTSLTTFTKFLDLPVELQLKIWSTFANSRPRTLDLWADFKRCEKANTIFYVPYYTCELSSLAAPSILGVDRVARAQCLKHYSLEFRCSIYISAQVNETIDAKMYINFGMDTLVPRGFWNIVTFEDMAKRVEGRLGTLAIDVAGSFWKDNLVDYCKKRWWIFNGVDEVVLYDSRDEPLFKGSEYLEKFRRKVPGRKDLSFVEVEEEKRSEDLKGVETFLGKMFDAIDERYGVDTDEAFVKKGTYTDMTPTKKETLRRPVVKLRKLVAETPTVEVASVDVEAVAETVV